MFKKSMLPKIMSMIREDDKVLDVGGWAQPFTRADWVIDLMPYESRGWFGFIGDSHERFTKETWVHRDICDRRCWPFKDKEFNFVFCSHTLEDLRDPLFVCSEIVRVGNKGYIEVPSLQAECSLGIESSRYCGWYHHRWLVEVHDNRLTFMMKPHQMHSSWRYHLPSYVGKRLDEEARASSLIWKGSFQFEEKIIIDKSELEATLESFTRSQGYYKVRFKLLDRYRHYRRKVGPILRRLHFIR